jgi:hypothetical protein
MTVDHLKAVVPLAGCVFTEGDRSTTDPGDQDRQA